MRVFKYRGGDDKIFERDLASLASDTFWAAKREYLNDPSEGFLISNIDAQIDTFIGRRALDTSQIAEPKNNLTKALTSLLEQRDKVGIFSLSQNYQDELLWAHYAYSHQGFCIEYDSERLMSSNVDDWYSFSIEYMDKPPELNIQDLNTQSSEGAKKFIQKMIGFKYTRWSYEKEVRVVCPDFGSQRYDYHAVKAIYFGLKMPNENKSTLMSRLRGRRISYYQMQLRENSYLLNAVEIEDEFANAPKYIPKLALVQSYAIDLDSLHEKWKSFASYLPKVAAVAQRVPWAETIEMVEVSNDRNKETEPVFFAQICIQRSNGRCKNVYYTVSEVDKEYAAIAEDQI